MISPTNYWLLDALMKREMQNRSLATMRDDDVTTVTWDQIKAVMLSLYEGTGND